MKAKIKVTLEKIYEIKTEDAKRLYGINIKNKTDEEILQEIFEMEKEIAIEEIDNFKVKYELIKE